MKGSKRCLRNHCPVGAGWGRVREKGPLLGTHIVWSWGYSLEAWQQCKEGVSPFHTQVRKLRPGRNPSYCDSPDLGVVVAVGREERGGVRSKGT